MTSPRSQAFKVPGALARDGAAGPTSTTCRRRDWLSRQRVGRVWYAARRQSRRWCFSPTYVRPRGPGPQDLVLHPQIRRPLPPSTSIDVLARPHPSPRSVSDGSPCRVIARQQNHCLCSQPRVLAVRVVLSIKGPSLDSHKATEKPCGITLVEVASSKVLKPWKKPVKLQEKGRVRHRFKTPQQVGRVGAAGAGQTVLGIGLFGRLPAVVIAC